MDFLECSLCDGRRGRGQGGIFSHSTRSSNRDLLRISTDRCFRQLALVDPQSVYGRTIGQSCSAI